MREECGRGGWLSVRMEQLPRVEWDRTRLDVKEIFRHASLMHASPVVRLKNTTIFVHGDADEASPATCELESRGSPTRLTPGGKELPQLLHGLVIVSGPACEVSNITVQSVSRCLRV